MSLLFKTFRTLMFASFIVTCSLNVFAKEQTSIENTLAIDYTFPENTDVHVVQLNEGVRRFGKIDRHRRHISKDKIEYGAKVQIRQSDKPFILVLLSQNKIHWHLNNEAKANLKAVIIGGRDFGTIDNLNENIPVLQTRLFNGSRAYFITKPSMHDSNLIKFIETMTDNKVRTYQHYDMRNEVIIKPEKEQNSIPENAELHVVSAHHSVSNSASKIDLNIEESSDNSVLSPIVLILDARTPVMWHINNPSRRQIHSIILTGNSFLPVTGITKNTQILHRYIDPINHNHSREKPKNETQATAYIPTELRNISGTDIASLTSIIQQNYSLQAVSSQAAYGAESFTIKPDAKTSQMQKLQSIDNITKDDVKGVLYAVLSHEGKSHEIAYSDEEYEITEIHIPEHSEGVSLMLYEGSGRQWIIHNPHQTTIHSVVYAGSPRQEFKELSDNTALFYWNNNSFRSDNVVEFKYEAEKLLGKNVEKIYSDYTLENVTLGD